MTAPTRPDADADRALEPDTLDALAAHHAAQAPPAGAAARIKRRVLARIADESTPRHLTALPAADTWQPFSAGIDIKVLNEAGGVMSYLLRFAPGAALPAHRHPIDEECVVLEGAVRIGRQLVVPAGGFHLAHGGSMHAPVSSDDGAVIFLRGASPHPADLV